MQQVKLWQIEAIMAGFTRCCRDERNAGGCSGHWGEGGAEGAVDPALTSRTSIRKWLLGSC